MDNIKQKIVPHPWFDNQAEEAARFYVSAFGRGSTIHGVQTLHEQCGWLKDKFGISWQIVPKILDTMMSMGTPEQIERVTKAFLNMKKFDIRKLREAYGETI